LAQHLWIHAICKFLSHFHNSQKCTKATWTNKLSTYFVSA